MADHRMLGISPISSGVDTVTILKSDFERLLSLAAIALGQHHRDEPEAEDDADRRVRCSDGAAA